MKFHPDAKIVIISSIIAIAILFFFANFNPQGQFSALSVDTQVTDELDFSSSLQLINELRQTDGTKDILLTSYNELNSENVRPVLPYKLEEMSKQKLREQLLLRWNMNGKGYTAQDIQKLDDSLDGLNNDVANVAALLVTTTNEADRLTRESLQDLTEEDLMVIDEIVTKEEKSESELRTLERLYRKVDVAKQVTAASYMLDAADISKAALISLNLQPGNQPSSNVVSGCWSISGDVLWYDPLLCDIIIGGPGFTHYDFFGPPPALIIDLGGDDKYWGDHAFGGLDYNSPQRITSTVIDVAGNDYYVCWNDASVWGSQCQGAYTGVGIFLDYAGNDEYECRGWCQGVGIFGGIGIFADMDGKDAYRCLYHCQGYAEAGIGIFYDAGDETETIICDNEYRPGTVGYRCQGSGIFGIGIMATTASTTFICNDQCQGHATLWSDHVGYGSFLINYGGNNVYNCKTKCQGFADELLLSMGGIPGMLLDFIGSDRYVCDHDCQGYRIDATNIFDINSIVSSGVVYDGDESYTRQCNYNCGFFLNDAEDEPSRLLPGGVGVPNIHDLTFCTQVGGGLNGVTYNIGAYVYVDTIKVGQCISGTVNPTVIFPIEIENVPTRINPMTNGTIIVTNCDWRITQQNLGSTNTNDYISNCKVGNTVNIPITTVNLPFYDNFDWCTEVNCALAGTQNATVENILYSYSNAPGTPAWYAFRGADAHTAGSIRSGTIGHNQESRLSFSVTLPALPDRAAVYFLSFNYKVVGEPKDTLQLLATKRPQISLGPLGTLENPNGVACLTAPGQTEITNQWVTFNQVPDPTNECSHLTPGEYTFDFIYKKDSSLSALPDAAFIDNLQINLIPVGP